MQIIILSDYNIIVCCLFDIFFISALLFDNCREKRLLDFGLRKMDAHKKAPFISQTLHGYSSVTAK